MKILFLCKRIYMSHDVILDRYARLYEIPRHLSMQGHNVVGVCLSYQNNQELTTKHADHLEWHSLNLLKPNIVGTYIRIRKLIRNIKPDAILASSDVLHIALAHHLAKKIGCPFYADLYDNYESFGLAKVPFLTAAYRKALRNAHYIYTVSSSLKEKIINETGHQRVSTIESTIDKSLFFRKDQMLARQALQLENIKGICVGLCGALDSSRGIEHFYKGFQQAQSANPSLKLILAGTPASDCPPPEGAILLGRLKHEQMNDFYNAMDINCISMIPDEFGKYAFPQKAYEMAASQKPVVAPSFGAIKELFSDFQSGLHFPCDVDSIAAAILRQANSPIPSLIEIPDWEQMCRRIKIEPSQY